MTIDLPDAYITAEEAEEISARPIGAWGAQRSERLL